jgi:RNA polymerase sigma-70 factor (ECF subfamily)
MNEADTEYFSGIYEKYSNDLYRICLLYLKSREEAEEAVSEAFVRIMEKRPVFESEAHEKAWLIKTAVNICKNINKSAWKRSVIHDDDVMQYITLPEERSVMEEVMALPPKYRIILYMHYYQGYKTNEIAEIMNMKQSTVLSRLSRGRGQLKEILTQGGFFYA